MKEQLDGLVAVQLGLTSVRPSFSRVSLFCSPGVAETDRERNQRCIVNAFEKQLN